MFVSRLLARRRKEIGTRKNTRGLGCYRQALFVLAWYRDKADIPRLGAGFGLSQATSYRYLAEGTTVIAAEAPGLEEALERAVREGTPYVILDEDRRLRPLPCENCQPEGPGDRPVVLGQEERLRREHPGPVLPGRPPDVDL